MAEVSPIAFRTHFEKSSLQPLIIQTETTLTPPLTHFEKSSLAASQKESEFLPSKPKIPPSFPSNASYQFLLIEHAKKLDKLQAKILRFDTEQIEKSAAETKRMSSKIFEINNKARQRQENASKWRTVAQITSIGLILSVAAPISISAIPAAIVSLSPIIASLRATFASQQLLNDAHLLRMNAEKTSLEHAFQKGIKEQSYLAQSSGDSAFRKLEEQIREIAIALDKQTTNF